MCFDHWLKLCQCDDKHTDTYAHLYIYTHTRTHTHTHTHTHKHNLIVGPQGGGWGEVGASRAPSITPLSEREGEAGKGGLGVEGETSKGRGIKKRKGEKR